jgi:hypothetical protein
MAKQDSSDEAVNYFLNMTDKHSVRKPEVDPIIDGVTVMTSENFLVLVNDAYMTVRDHNSRKIMVKFSDISMIDTENLSAEFAQQPALYAYFGMLVGMAEKRVADLDLKKDQAFADADEFYREEFEKAGKKVTEAVIKNEVHRDEAYIKAYKLHAEAESQLTILKNFLKALDQRAQMLISSGAQTRHEIGMTNMTINEQDSVATVKDVLGKRRPR